MLCPKCGTANPDTSKQCFNCGQILTEGTDAPGAHSSAPQWGGEPVPEWLLDLQKGLPEELRDPALEKILRQKTVVESRLEQPLIRDKREKPIVTEEVPAEIHTESDEWLNTVLNSMRSDFVAPAESEKTLISAQEPVVSDESWLDAFISSSKVTGPQVSEDSRPDVSPTETPPQDDWLHSVRSTLEDAEPEEETAESAADVAQEIPDWLDRPFVAQPMTTLGPSQAEQIVPPAGGPDLPAWLAEMDVASADQASSTEGDKAVPAVSAGREIAETPDWLQSFVESSTEIAETPISPDTAVPDWLRDHQKEQLPEEPAPTAAQSVPDWLTGHAVEPPKLLEQESETVSFKSVELPIRPEESAEPEESVVEAEAAEDTASDVTVWIRPVPAGADMPEWLSNLKAQDDIPPPEETAPDKDESYEEIEIPSWLQASQAVPGQPTDISLEAPPEPQPKADEEEIILPTEIFGPIPEQPSLEKEENVPEWLRDSLQEAYDELPSIPLIEVEKGLLGRDFETTPTIPLAQAKPGEAPAETPDMPEWLRQLRTQDTIEGTQPPSWLTEPEIELETELPEEEIPQVQEETPSWLMGITPSVDVEAIGAEAAPPKEDETPDWLRDLGSAPEEASKETLEIGEREVPAWLKQMGGSAALDEEAEQMDAAETEAFQEIGTDQIPVSEQRTMKASVPIKPARDKSEISTEAIPRVSVQGLGAEGAQMFPLKESAILAGIGAALTPPADLSLLKPEQQIIPEALAENMERASVFQEIVSQPLVSRESILGRKHTRLWVTVGRILLYLLIIAVAAITLYWQGAQDVGFFHEYNMPISPRTQTVHAQINSVPERSTVLLIADYDPSLAEELNAQARTLLQNLTQRNLKILVVSTAFAGPQVLQNIMEDVVQRGAVSYEYGEDYINLGYLPGQETSLLLFGQNPLAAVRTDFRDQRDLRNYDLLAATLRKVPEKGLGQVIPLVVYLGGNEESLRIWIEQVLAQQADVRMIAGVSAGLEPYAYPYLESGQLAGLLSGLIGAAEYESLTKNPGRAVRSIDSQIGIHLVIVGSIVLGNIVYILRRILRRR